MIGVTVGGNLMGKKLGLVMLGLLTALMAVMGVIAAVRDRHAWVLLPFSVALAVASWRAFQEVSKAPAPARKPWYR